ncbi:MAG: phosphatidate cytidylyltransferase [Pseudomonadota bacterium]
MLPSVTVLSVAALGLLGLGGAALCLLALVPRTAKVARDALPILGTEILIVGTAVAAFWLGGWVLLLALGLMAIRVIYEAETVSALSQPEAPKWRVLLSAVAFGALPLLWSQQDVPFWIFLLVPPAFVIGLALARRILPADYAARLDPIGLAVFPLSILWIFVIAGAREGFAPWLLLAFLFVETFDSYALLGGKFFGRTKAFPTLSPNKTIEGLAAGTLMLMATAAVGALVLGAPVWPAIGLALLTMPLAIAGDLLASRIKRRAGVKDYPAILPRQGGLFDITDAWIVTGAGFAVLAYLTGAI